MLLSAFVSARFFSKQVCRFFFFFFLVFTRSKILFTHPPSPTAAASVVVVVEPIECEDSINWLHFQKDVTVVCSWQSNVVRARQLPVPTKIRPLFFVSIHEVIASLPFLCIDRSILDNKKLFRYLWIGIFLLRAFVLLENKNIGKWRKKK